MKDDRKLDLRYLNGQNCIVNRAPKILIGLILSLSICAMPVLGDGVITGIGHRLLASGEVEIQIDMPKGEVQSRYFLTRAPPRIVLDFFGVSNQIPDRMIKVSEGSVDSITTIGSEGRTRIIVNLIDQSVFRSSAEDQKFLLVVGPTDHSSVAVIPDDISSEEELGITDGKSGVVLDGIDFRRRGGGGEITFELDDVISEIEVQESASELVIIMQGVNSASGLQRSIDVTDFATPVKSIDVFQVDVNTHIVLSVDEQYSQSSYQEGTSFILSVVPKRLEQTESRTDESGYSGSPISLDLQNVPVRGALQIIAQESGLNFVISDSVNGNLSMRLADVPWDQVLDTILQTKGLVKRNQGNVIWIAPAEEVAQMERLALETSRQAIELKPLVSELVQINYAKASDIGNILRSVRAVNPGMQQSVFGSVSLGEVPTEENRLLSERGSVTVDDRTNSLLIQDTAEKIGEIRKLIGQLDRPVKQVMIETRIVEANDEFSRNIGARLGLSGITNTPLGSLIGSGSIENTGAIRGDGISASGDGSLGVDLPATSIRGNAPGSYAFTLANGLGSLIDLELSALEAEGDGKIIANPRLLTADKQEAHIEQGQERIFTTSTMGEGSVITKKAVLGLTVTPQITPDDRLILDVFVTKDSFVSATEENINTLQIRTQVLLNNGETVVIGGIYEQQIGKSTTKIPVLGDLPVLGLLFRKTGTIDKRTELLVFLTPRIINPSPSSSE